MGVPPEPTGEPTAFRRLETYLDRCFPALERATVDAKAAWTRTILDPATPIEEQLAAMHSLGEALGAFDGAEPDEVAE